MKLDEKIYEFIEQFENDGEAVAFKATMSVDNDGYVDETSVFTEEKILKLAEMSSDEELVTIWSIEQGTVALVQMIDRMFAKILKRENIQYEEMRTECGLVYLQEDSCFKPSVEIGISTGSETVDITKYYTPEERFFIRQCVNQLASYAGIIHDLFCKSFTEEKKLN